METRSMISFDWAMKRLLRQKANFEVLEGFLSELLRRAIIIKNIVESEGNKTDKKDKWNKVDILVEADGEELVIIELQYDSENDYFQRMLYGVSKAIIEYIDEGEPYSTIRKIYSINIVYFDLGKGDDYVYHGVTNFKGIHTFTELQLTETQQKLYGKTIVGELHPEYYIIKVKKFDDEIQNPLDEWIYYLKYNKIGDDFKAKGLAKARKILGFDKLSDKEKKKYWRNVEDRRIRNSEISTAHLDGKTKGEAIGLKKGKAIGLEKGKSIGLKKGEAIGLKKGKVEGEAIGLEKGKVTTMENIVVESKKNGFSLEQILLITKLSSEQIMEILKRNNMS